jgi:hypothetical protein
MDRSNVETVIVAGKVRKWNGKLLDVDLQHLRRQLEASRNHIFGGRHPAGPVPVELKPSEAWCYQQGGSPCQGRANHPPVPSVAVVEEVHTNGTKPLKRTKGIT